MAAQLVGREATSDDVELATWILAKMGEAQSAADVASALWTMQTFSRQWLGWSAAFDVLLTPTVGVPPLPIGAYKLSTLQRQGLKLLAALPAGALLSQRAKIIEAFEPVFEASPYTMVANVTGQPSMSLPLHWTDDGLPMGMLFTARIGDEATLFRLAAQLEQAMPWRIASRRTRSPDRGSGYGFRADRALVLCRRESRSFRDSGRRIVSLVDAIVLWFVAREPFARGLAMALLIGRDSASSVGGHGLFPQRRAVATLARTAARQSLRCSPPWQGRASGRSSGASR